MLDTNIVSLLDQRRRSAAPALIDWMAQTGDRLFLSAMTITEMEAGILKLRREHKGKRADELQLLLERILADFGDRVLSMDALVAQWVARLAEEARPRVIELADLIIAATAKRNDLILLSANLRHFEGLSLECVNPLERLP